MNKELRKSPAYNASVFKKLSIANTVVCWIAFVFALGIAASGWTNLQECMSKGIEIKYAEMNNLFRYMLYIGVALVTAVLALSIAQSVFAKKVGKIAEKIGYEQVICLLIIFAGLASVGCYVCGSEIEFLRTIADWSKNTLVSSWWVVTIAVNSALVASVFLLGSAIYNTVIDAKLAKKK